MFKALNFPIEPIAETKDDIVFDELYNKRSSLIYVTPSHQYPFGTAFDLIKVAINSLGSYIFIIEDDYDGEYRYGQKTSPALASLDPTRCISIEKSI